MRRGKEFLVNFRFGPYFVSPVIAGLDKISENEYKPIICTYDSIGYREHSGVFETGGTSAELLMGVCETFYKPNMEPE
jgi:20S proteasome subunit beta 3